MWNVISCRVILWAPFLNFRKFPRDPSLQYPWSVPEDPSKIRSSYAKYPYAEPEDYDNLWDQDQNTTNQMFYKCAVPQNYIVVNVGLYLFFCFWLQNEYIEWDSVAKLKVSLQIYTFYVEQYGIP